MFEVVRNMEIGFAITLAVAGLILGMIHTARQAEQQWKSEFVPVKVEWLSLNHYMMNRSAKEVYEQYQAKRLNWLLRQPFLN